MKASPCSFSGQFLTFVPHGEQTLVEKDSRSNKHIFRAYPSTSKIAELCFETTAAHSTIHPKRSALSAFSLFEEQAQALLSYYHFLSFLILHYIYYISLYTTFHREPTLKTALELRDYSFKSRQKHALFSLEINYECIKFTKRAEQRTDF